MDLYAVLGLGPEASLAEIKRAYRRLARRYHPGVNPGDRAAEALFHRINDAYETLIDPARRQQYDAGGGGTVPPRAGAASTEFAGFDFSVAAQGRDAATFTELFADILHPASVSTLSPEPGADVHTALAVSFLDAVRGVQRQVVVTRQHLCETCRGTGYVAAMEGRCAQCHGGGALRWARGHMLFAKSCPACGGTGRLRHQRCGACGTQGRVVRSDAVPVFVPPGTYDGARLWIEGEGHAGRGGGRTGDLYVTVQVAPHPLFRREGDDLHMHVPVAVHEAVLGARIEVPSLEGTVRLRVPPGTQAGQQFRLRGLGVPRASGGRGDLVAHVKLVLPAVADERSRELMREFGRLNNEDVRKDLRG